MTGPVFELTDQPADHDVQAVFAGLVRHNEAMGASMAERRLLAVFARAAGGTGTPVGGLVGATGWGWLFIQFMWVDEAARGRGLGGELLTRAEAEAIARGCQAAWLETFGDDARQFYERHGYRVFGTLDDYPSGQTRYFLTKRLGGAP